MANIKVGQHLFMPTDTRLTVFGVKHEKNKGNSIQLSKFKVLNIYWEEIYYPYPHSAKRIELKKGAGKVYVRYAETVENILSVLN